AGGATAGTLGIGQVQLAGDEAAGALVTLVVDHDVRAAHLVLAGRLAGVAGGGARCRRRLLALAVDADRTLGLFPGRRQLGAAAGGFLGGGAGGLFLGLAAGLLGLALLAALAIGLGQGGQLGLLARLALLELAQGLGALLVDGGVDVVALDVGALLPDLDRDGGLALAGTDRQLLLLAPLQGDLLRNRGLARLLVLAVGAAQEAQQLHLLGAADHLVRAAEGHAGAGQLLEQLLDGHSQHLGQRTNGDFRHVIAIPCFFRAGARWGFRGSAAHGGHSNQCLRAAMIRAAARSSFMPSTSRISSVARSARSSRVTMPRAARA